MAIKFLAVLAFAAVVSQGHAVTEIWLSDVTRSYTTNPFSSQSIGIVKSFVDTLLTCSVIFPNGVLYEAYPNNNMPDPTISYFYTAQPFTACSISFRNTPSSSSGTYELLSHLRHGEDRSESLTRQRYHLTFTQRTRNVHPKLTVKSYDSSDE